MDYPLIRSRRKTVSIQIKADGTVLVRAPMRMPLREIETLSLPNLPGLPGMTIPSPQKVKYSRKQS